MRGGYRDADFQQEGDAAASDNYWEASADLSLSGGVAQNGFWGTSASWIRHRADNDANEQYHLLGGNIFYRHRLWRMLSGSLSYRHTRRYYGAGATDGDYFENRVMASLSATL